MKRILFFAAMLSLAAGCGRNKSDAGLDASARALDLSSCEQVTDLSDYIADVKIVRLAPEPVIYSGSGKILTYDGKFIVLSDSFVEYNADGSLSKTIGRVGRGPGEFVAVTDFCIDDAAGQLVCLTPDNKVLR